MTSKESILTNLEILSENIDSSISIFKIQDNKETLVFANKRFLHHVGIKSLNEYSRGLWLKAVSETDKTKIQTAIFQSLQTGTAINVLFKFAAKDKSLWFNKRIKAIWQDEPNTILFLSVTDDVTDQENIRLQKDAQLRQQQERSASYQRELLKNSSDTNLICQGFANLTKDIVEFYFFLNPQRTLPFTSSYKENQDMVADTAAFSKDKEKIYELFARENLIQRFLDGKYDTEFTYTRKAIDAGLYWTKLHVHTSRNSQDSDIIAYIRAIDVSNQFLESLIIKRLAETQFDYVAIIDIATRQIFMRNIKDDLHATNPRLSANYDEDSRFAVEKVVAPNDKKRTLRNMDLSNIIAHLDKNETYSYAFSVVGADGQRFRKELHYCYLSEEKQDILMSRIDTTKQYIEEEKQRNNLRRALDMAKQSEQAKENFFSQLSHDIRTPMNGILGIAELAKGCGKIDQYDNALADIKTSGQFMMSLLNDVLDVSKMNDKSFTLHVVPYLYNDFAKDIKSMILPKAKEKDIQVILTCKKFSTGCALFDKMRLQQIFINLISNAIKYNKKGGKVEMTTEYKEGENGQGFFEFHVRDNGIGMSKDFIKNHLFHEFEQEKATSEYSMGTGLGLYIVKRLVRKMQGTITCESVVGQGTDFTLRLPSQVVPAQEHQDTDNSEGNVSALKGKKVLLCEDHPINTKIATVMLKRVGILVESAENGQIGLNKFKSSQPGYYDAILMDVRMPKMDGLEATKAIRALSREDAKTVPIIALSANAFDEDVRISLSAGMNEHLSKPIEPAVIYQTLIKYITRNAY